MTDSIPPDEALARKQEQERVDATLAAIAVAKAERDWTRVRALERAAIAQTDNGPRPGDGDQPSQEAS